MAFAPPTASFSQATQARFSRTTTTTTSLNANSNKNDNEGSDDDNGLLDRFLKPKIDDPALPLTEAGIAQIAGPTLQLFWLVSLNSPYPSWATPLYDPTFPSQGAFLVPTLIHGAALSCCWLLGCLAAKAYEQSAYKGTFGSVTASTVKAGAFACGILILGTQFDLYQEYGGYVQLGDSAEADLRIYRASVEVINDIFFAVATLLPWRLFRSTLAN
jgi:hypothetical protein